MVASNFTSRLKMMVFTVFGLSIILSLSLLFLTTPIIFEAKFWNEWQSIMILISAIAIVAFGSVPLLKMRSISIEQQQIVFQKYVFGSNIRKINLKDYDHYKIVLEESENGFFEAVWLIKDGKLVDSFSTYQYSNYKELKFALNVKNKGELDMSPMKQLRCRFGSKF